MSETTLSKMTGIQRLRFAVFSTAIIWATVIVFSEFSIHGDNSVMLPFYIGLTYANTMIARVLFEPLFNCIGKARNKINTCITNKSNEYL